MYDRDGLIVKIEVVSYISNRIEFGVSQYQYINNDLDYTLTRRDQILVHMTLCYCFLSNNQSWRQ